MKIAIVGTGYVGLVTGACFAQMGSTVCCVDIDQAKIRKLQQGIIPIYEPGLEELVRRNIQSGRLTFTDNLNDCINQVEVLFCAVGTPPDQHGNADLQHVFNVAQQIGKLLNNYLLVVTKSTVPPGTSHQIQRIIQQELANRHTNLPFDIAANPEFLKEGAAIKDFMSPDRVIVGVESQKAQKLMTQLYRPFLLNNFRVIFMDILSAELTKYAANAMLATRISFINDIANLCEHLGANIDAVRKGIGSDARIGNHFLYPGCGYGGSCFPKDINALIQTAQQHHAPLRLLQAVQTINNEQKTLLFRKLNNHYHGNLRNRKIALWGLTFKPDTDDIREAPSLAIIQQLLSAGCQPKVYDPVALNHARQLFGQQLYYATDIYDAVTDTDALLLITEWKEFRLPAWTTVKQRMHTPLILDGRNIYDKNELAELGFTTYRIGG